MMILSGYPWVIIQCGSVTSAYCIMLKDRILQKTDEIKRKKKRKGCQD